MIRAFVSEYQSLNTFRVLSSVINIIHFFPTAFSKPHVSCILFAHEQPGMFSPSPPLSCSPPGFARLFWLKHGIAGPCFRNPDSGPERPITGRRKRKSPLFRSHNINRGFLVFLVSAFMIRPSPCQIYQESQPNPSALSFASRPLCPYRRQRKVGVVTLLRPTHKSTADKTMIQPKFWTPDSEDGFQNDGFQFRGGMEESSPSSGICFK
jgi:hypothetical protein